jgi:hypothetical protein
LNQNALCVAVLFVATVSQLGLMQHAEPGAGATTKPATSLSVAGAGVESKEFDLAALNALPRTTVKVKDNDGTEVVWEGVRISEILISCGMELGNHSLRGSRLAEYLLAEATDGYRVVYALPELDAEFSDRVVIVANQCDGKPLSERDGPLRIIVSDEKRHARWVRNVVALRVLTAPKAE